MALYTYTAKSGPNKTVSGNIESESEQQAINKLTQLGLFPLSIVNEQFSLSGQDRLHRAPKISNKDLVLFTRQLSTLIDSGVNIVDALNIVTNQLANKYFKLILKDISAKLKDGKPLSDSMAAYPKLFPGVYSSMVRIGEISGSLNTSLKSLADFMEREEEFKNSLISSLTYPLFVFFVGVSTIVVLLVFVIPRLVTMFEDMGQALPLPTKVLIDISAFMRGYWWMIIMVVGGSVFMWKRAKKNPQARLAIDKFKLKIILIGRIILKTEVGRLMRTLSLLLSSGVSIVPSLEIAELSLGNEALRADVSKFKGEISNGASLSGVFANSKFFPQFVTNIVAVGEETGSLGKSLLRIAEDYEKDVDRMLKGLTRMAEPIIILIMGIMVGFIVMSMLLPIFQINLTAR